MECLTGLCDSITGGHILYDNKDITGYNASKMRDLGIAHITGERYIRGDSKTTSIHDNIIMGAHKRAQWSSKYFMNKKKLSEMVDNLIKEYNIVCSSPTAAIMNLSGGNVQKCIFARELNLAKKLIIAEEPTRGVDIGAIEFIHSQLIKKSSEGYGVILVSTDLDEIISLSTKIIVMFDGRIVGQINPDAEGLESKIGLMMAGATL